MPKIIKSVQTGVAAAGVILIAICLILSVIQLFTDISNSMLTYISVAVLGTVSFSAAYISTQLCRSKGLLQGILCGAVVFGLTLFASAVAHEFSFTDLTMIKAAVCLISGTVGGIKGINTRKTNLKRFWH